MTASAGPEESFIPSRPPTPIEEMSQPKRKAGPHSGRAQRKIGACQKKRGPPLSAVHACRAGHRCEGATRHGCRKGLSRRACKFSPKNRRSSALRLCRKDASKRETRQKIKLRGSGGARPNRSGFVPCQGRPIGGAAKSKWLRAVSGAAHGVYVYVYMCMCICRLPIKILLI